MPALLAVVSGGIAVSAGMVAATRSSVSLSAAFGFDCADSRSRAASFGLGSRASKPSHTAATKAARAIHLAGETASFRAFSSLSVVPHHLHESTCAG